jgi:hypothetical protein
MKRGDVIHFSSGGKVIEAIFEKQDGDRIECMIKTTFHASQIVTDNQQFLF